MIVELLLASSLLSTFVDALYRDMSDTIYASKVDSLDRKEKTEKVHYKGQQILFQHQAWKINHETVCGDYKQYSNEHTACTRLAKEYFTLACSSLGFDELSRRYGQKLEAMFCSASASYSPTIAEVYTPKTDSELEQIRSRCSVLILKTQKGGSSEMEQEKNRVCSKYKKLVSASK